MHEIEEQLLKELESFTAFARSRVGDSHLAADLVQDSLLKALKSSDQPRDGEGAVTWFYRILRHSIIDLYRRRDVRERALERFQAPQDPVEMRRIDEGLEADYRASMY